MGPSIEEATMTITDMFREEVRKQGNIAIRPLPPARADRRFARRGVRGLTAASGGHVGRDVEEGGELVGLGGGVAAAELDQVGGEVAVEEQVGEQVVEVGL